MPSEEAILQYAPNSVSRFALMWDYVCNLATDDQPIASKKYVDISSTELCLPICDSFTLDSTFTST
jgi:hypothetical protein